MKRGIERIENNFKHAFKKPISLWQKYGLYAGNMFFSKRGVWSSKKYYAELYVYLHPKETNEDLRLMNYWSVILYADKL